MQRLLSTELQPPPGGTVYGLCALDDDTLVVGDDGGGCVMWRRAGGPSGRDFVACASLLEHEGAAAPGHGAA